LPFWDGSLDSLETQLGGRSRQILARNQGWINYNGYVVGTEGQIITTGQAPMASRGTPDDTETYNRHPTRYVAPTRRNGRIALQGNQSWNFYLIGKSIDGGETLNSDRRWFGSPDEDASTYIPDLINPSRLIRRYAEGSLTINGFNTVDESLLLNFQAILLAADVQQRQQRRGLLHAAGPRMDPRAGRQPAQPPASTSAEAPLDWRPPTDPEYERRQRRKGLEVTNAKA
jgi:hypothetical protein